MKGKSIKIPISIILIFAIIIGICIYSKKEEQVIKTNIKNQQSVQYTTITDTKANIQKAIYETAMAYYRKGTNIQYDNYRYIYSSTPEDATKDDVRHSVCTVFAYQVYKTALGIDVPISSILIQRYAANGANPVSDNYLYKEFNKHVVTYLKGESYDKIPEDKNFTRYNYIKNKAPLYTLLTKKSYTKAEFTQITNLDKAEQEEKINELKDAPSDGNIIAQNLIDIYDLQVGDMLSTVTLTGETDIFYHTMLVSEMIYQNGKAVDAWLLHSTGSNLGRNKANDSIETQGTIEREKLSERFAERYTSNIIEFNIIRPLGDYKDAETNYFAPDYGHEKAEQRYDETKKQIIKLTDYAKIRLNYEGIDIDKTSSKHTDSLVNLGDEIIYTVKIKNNSSKTYTGIKIEENISNLVEIVDYGGGSYSNNKLTWENISVSNGGTVTKQYKVRVKENVQNLNQEIISTGTVADIKSATIRNYIKNTLTEEQKQKIIETTESLKNSSTERGVALVKKIYKQALNVDIGLNDNITVNDIIGNEVNYNSNNNKYRNVNIINNNLKNMIKENNYGRHDATILNPQYDVTLGHAEISDQRQTGVSIVKGNVQVGDIVLIQEDNLSYVAMCLGDYMIYLDSNKFGIINDENKPSSEQYETDKFNLFFASLATKDGFVILTPSMMMPQSIKINEAAGRRLEVGETLNLTATIYGTDANIGTKKTWKSDNDTIAEVNQNGQVTARKGGMCTITVETENGKKDTYNIVVNSSAPIEPPVAIGEIEIKYVEKSTNTELESRTYQSNIGDTVYLNQFEKTINGYTLIGRPQETTTTISEYKQTFTYYYAANTTVTVRYKDKTSKQEIYQAVVEQGYEGKTYDVTNKKQNIANYTYIETEGNTKGQMTKTPIEVTYYYAANTTVTVRYKDKTSKQEIHQAVVEQGYEGKTYDVTNKKQNIANYTYIETEGNIKGQMTKTPIEVTYYYAANTTVTVRYKDKTSKQEIHQAVVEQGYEGKTYDVTNKKQEIANYTYIETEGNTKGQMTKTPIEVIFYYIKQTENEPGEDKPGEDKPGEDKPGEDKPGEDKPGEDKPGEDKPGEDKPGEDKPGEDKPGEDKPGEDKPGEDNSGGNNSEENNSNKNKPNNNESNSPQKNVQDIENNQNSNEKHNNSISTKALPYTGKYKIFILGIIASLIASLIFYKKSKKYKDI